MQTSCNDPVAVFDSLMEQYVVAVSERMTPTRKAERDGLNKLMSLVRQPGRRPH
ncbi:hypothetical protein BN8_05046 [Fibrisoma limi BUZ 3]|uniref:Uncharacterized protein n=2 Tax=Fibrisoma limi TaxID=663275 RepID=I2GPD3_9BACT|nr:hypothetical protein BN8_05046 [Fibrisoma limi BUZ 3]